jgi:hypothetical protein
VEDTQAANAYLLSQSLFSGFLPKYAYSLNHLALTYLGIQVMDHKKCYMYKIIKYMYLNTRIKYMY